jgi:hypothetical protein
MRDDDRDQPILLHGEPLGRRLLRTGCLIVLVVLAMLIALVFGPLHEFFTLIWHGPGPM